MSPFLEHGQIPTGQEAALRMSEALAAQTVGQMGKRALEAGDVPDIFAAVREERCRELASAMVSGCTEAWLHADSGLADPLQEYRTLMYVEVGNPNKWWRHTVADPLETVVGENRGKFRCFSYAVAAMVDWDNNEAVIIAKDPYVDDAHGGNWTIRRHNLVTGEMREERIMQVEKGRDPSDVTLYASPHGPNPMTLGSQSPTYYSLKLNEKYRAEQVVVSRRVGQSGRGTFVVGAVLLDDIGVLHTQLGAEIKNRGLSEGILTDPSIPPVPIALREAAVA